MSVENKDKKVSFRIPNKTYQAIKQLSDEEGITVSSFCRKWVTVPTQQQINDLSPSDQMQVKGIIDEFQDIAEKIKNLQGILEQSNKISKVVNSQNK